MATVTLSLVSPWKFFATYKRKHEFCKHSSKQYWVRQLQAVVARRSKTIKINTERQSEKFVTNYKQNCDFEFILHNQLPTIYTCILCGFHGRIGISLLVWFVHCWMTSMSSLTSLFFLLFHLLFSQAVAQFFCIGTQCIVCVFVALS